MNQFERRVARLRRRGWSDPDIAAHLVASFQAVRAVVRLAEPASAPAVPVGAAPASSLPATAPAGGEVGVASFATLSPHLGRERSCAAPGSSRERYPDLPGDPERMRQLWCAVIGRHLDDARGNFGGGALSKNGEAVAGYWARSWFASRDFREVCDLAGLDPDAVQERLQATLPARPAAAE